MERPLIAFDARQVRPGMTGVGRRAGHLLRVMATRESDFRWGLITNTPDFLERWLLGDAPGDSDHQVPPWIQIWSTGASPDSHPWGDWWLDRRLPGLLRRQGAALYHGPAFQVPGRKLALPVVLTVHDLAHRQRPLTQPWRFRRFLHRSIRRGVRVAERVIVPSADVARDLAVAHPEVGERIVVIPGGVSPEMRPMSLEESALFRLEHRLPDRFLLHVGTFEPRKNHRLLLEVHGALCAEEDDPPTLVMVGQRGSTLASVQRWIGHSPWRERIRVLTAADDATVHGLLCATTVFLFPSLSEGFGLPPLEAMACGTPVLLTNVPGMFHLARSPVVMLPLGSPQPWVEAIQRLLQDGEMRQALAEEGRAWASRMTWARAGEELLELYRQTLRGQGGAKIPSHMMPGGGTVGR